MIIRKTKEEILSRKIAAYNIDDFYKARKDNDSIAVERNASPLDIEFLNLIFDGITPTFFLGRNSSSIVHPRSIDKFLAGYQLSNNYYMPVTYKDIHKKKTSSWTDSEGKVHIKSFTDTSRKNINSVRAALIDIDHHSEEDSLSPEELDHLAEAINYFAEEEQVAPTAIINSGRGVQLVYVLKEPVYRNKYNIDKLLKAFQKALITKLDRDVLPNLPIPLKCDTATNPINQKMRLPGTLNYKSGSYAHVVVLNSHRLYNMSNFLSEELGDYEAYKAAKEARKKTQKRKKKSNRKGNPNKKNNMGIYFTRRIDAIKSAIIYASEKQGTGFRNRSYYALVWQMLSSLNNSSVRYSSHEDIAQEIQELDSSLKVPYFKNHRQILSFIASTEKTIKHPYLSNSSIVDCCIALQIAHEDGVDVNPFFEPTQKQTRAEKRKIRSQKEEALLKAITNSILNNKTIKSMTEDLDRAKNTIYNKMKILAGELNLRLTGSSVAGLFKRIRKALIKELMKAKNSTNLIPFFSKVITELENQWNNRPVKGISDSHFYTPKLQN